MNKNKIAFLCLGTMAVITAVQAGEENYGSNIAPGTQNDSPGYFHTYENFPKEERIKLIKNEEGEIASIELDRNGKPVGYVEVKYKNGARYSGMWKDGEPDGKGTKTYSDGRRYEGNWKNGREDGRGAMEWANTYSSYGKLRYSGEWRNGSMCGKGTMTYVNGNTFTGEWDRQSSNRYIEDYDNNLPNGGGILTDKNGVVLFEGIWKNGLGYDGPRDGHGKAHGKGVGVSIDGGRYEGDWVHGMREGRGTLISANGDRYEGDWVYDRKEGKGTLVSAYGEKYEGDWVKGVKDGEGTATWPRGFRIRNGRNYSYDKCSYTGHWHQGEPDGKGKATYVNGYKHDGNWSKGRARGDGVLKDRYGRILLEGIWEYGNGYMGPRNAGGRPHGKGVSINDRWDRYEGDWVDGLQHGQGTKTYPDYGYTYKGSWSRGWWEGKGTVTYASGAKYTGDCDCLSPHGEGVLKDPKGVVLFKGKWKEGLGYDGAVDSEGKAHGKGVGVYARGKRYEGDWVAGKEHGYGTSKERDGVYVGEWNNGQKTKGRKTFANGYTYEGEWEYDWINGKGTLIDDRGNVVLKGRWMGGRGYDGEVNSYGSPHGHSVSAYITGDRYEGEWAHGSIEGKGMLVYSNGSKYTGELKGGMADGEGVLTDKYENVVFKGVWKDGFGYEGSVNEQGEPHGKGGGVYISRPKTELSSKNQTHSVPTSGYKYVGDWVDGKREGNGKVILLDGREYEGIWKDDNLIASIPNSTLLPPA